MNVQSKRGGAVHASKTGSPSCNPWQSAAKFRTTDAAITCKTCIRRGYGEQDAPAEDADVIVVREMTIVDTED